MTMDPSIQGFRQGPSDRNLRPRGALAGPPAFRRDGSGSVLQADELPAGPSDRSVPEPEPSGLVDAGMLVGMDDMGRRVDGCDMSKYTV